MEKYCITLDKDKFSESDFDSLQEFIRARNVSIKLGRPKNKEVDYCVEVYKIEEGMWDRIIRTTSRIDKWARKQPGNKDPNAVKDFWKLIEKHNRR